ncbi:MAG TPA: ferrichrome ABC transporter permease, partial [Planctomycetota bacterium]|nr:ferrichrome ABC transporter permease [Planctomycetota bacterium]
MTIFLGAFLLFLVQPLLGKAILPAFGGTPAVWLTCLLFFQILLLGGYVYAYLVGRLRSPRLQGAVHVAALGAMLFWLPILPTHGFTPDPGSSPTLSILLQLARSVGGPFLVLAATGPLLQAWYVRRFPGRSPYRLYALSNAGSLLALLGYPLFVEPALALGDQARLWSVGLAIFAIACVTWAWRARTAQAAAAPIAADVQPTPRPDKLTIGLWFVLSTCGSALLLATTSQISQNVAAVPLLWVVPLALYLVTFILCFEHPRWSRRGPVAWMVAVALPLTGGVAVFGHEMGMAPQVAVLCFTLFAGCMACHGELARLAPAPRHLAAFYLCIAAGGALGSALVTVVAPQIFEVVLEFPVSLAAVVIAMLIARRRESLLAWARRPRRRGKRRALVAAGALVLVA